MFYGVEVGSLSEVNIDGIIIKVVEKPEKSISEPWQNAC